MAVSLVGLVLLTLATPVFAISDQTFGRNVGLVLSAIILILAACETSGKISFVVQRLKVFWLAAIVVTAWLAFQLVPLPSSSLTNSLWAATALALDEHSITAHVTVDPAITLRSMVTYLSSASLVISAAIVARDRFHAKALLVALGFACTVVALLFVLDQVDPAVGLPAPDGMGGSVMAAAAAMAILANGSILVMVASRDEGMGSLSRLPLAAFAVLGIAISFLALRTAFASSVVALAGLAVVGFIPFVRRLRLRSWQALVLFLVLVPIVAGIMISFVGLKDLGLSDLATYASSEDRLDVQRALADAPILGTGAGTFGSVMPMYRGFGLPPMSTAPSTAIAISIEWGRCAFWVLVAAAAALYLVLFWGALRRGRDAHFASFAAAVVLVTLCKAFLDASLLGPASQVTLAIAIGLGLSQRVSDRQPRGHS